MTGISSRVIACDCSSSRPSDRLNVKPVMSLSAVPSMMYDGVVWKRKGSSP
jgi:hypothetical protein